MSAPGRIWADPARERLNTPATVVTVVRTVVSVALSAVAASQQDLTLLVVALVVHWVGDSLDGWVARVRDCETRTGAVLDILCDRLCFAAFYVGLAWLEPHLAPAIFVYLAMFMVVDCFVSLGFLAWPITSPNYFYVIDRGLVAAELVPPRQGPQLGPVRDPAAGHRVDVARTRHRAGPARRQELLPGQPAASRDAHPQRASGELRGLGTGREGRSPVKLVLTTLLVAFGSALLPFVNIEAYLAAVGAAIRDVGVWEVAAAAAIGQTAGKVGLYYAADWAMRLPWIRKKMASPKWARSYERWQTWIDEHPGGTGGLLFASASVGFPPLYVMAVLAGQLRVNIWLFVSTCLVGRYIRFLVLLGAADWIVVRLT